MAWLILSVILGAGFVVALLFVTQPRERMFALLTVPVVWIIVSLFFTVHSVGQLQAGIPYNFSGTISGDDPKSPGVVFTWPWQHIKKENVGIQREEFVLDTGNSAVSADQQPIYANVTLNYQVEPQHVVDLYKAVGPQWKKTLLDSRVLQDFKEVTSRYSAAEITTKRSQLRAETKERLAEELAPYDVRVVDFFVKNISYSSTYRNAIDAKNRQVQRALQAQAKVKQSTAEAEQAIAKAKGDARAIELRGRALRRNPGVLQLEAIDKLSPNAQVIICTGKTCPSFLPSGLVGGAARPSK